MQATGGAASSNRCCGPQDVVACHAEPWVDPDNFNPGYILRGQHLLPRQGDRAPWLHSQDYWSERDELPVAPLDDGSLQFR